jgi:hypothetical protein
MILTDKKKVRVSKPDGICCRIAGFIIVLLSAIVFMNYTSISFAGSAATGRIPFQPGEKLTYEGNWNKIPAGELTLEVLPKEKINGIESYHFAMVTKTNATVDLIYKIRDRQDSFVDAGMTRSIFYSKKTESKHPRDVSLNFDWTKHEATYTNFGKKDPPVKILPGTFDPLALIYIIRLQNLKENSEIYIPLTDGKRNFEIKAVVGKKDVITIEGKKYNVVEITPDMEMSETLKKVVKKKTPPQFKMWVTDDERRIPVKIRSKVGIISFDFDFVPGLSSIR